MKLISQDWNRTRSYKKTAPHLNPVTSSLYKTILPGTKKVPTTPAATKAAAATTATPMTEEQNQNMLRSFYLLFDFLSWLLL